jgi:hypothetical protein
VPLHPVQRTIGPELEPLGMAYAAGEPVDIEAGVLAAMENFRDVAHFPFVQPRTIGSVPHQVSKFAVRREGYETWMTRSYSAATGEAELFRVRSGCDASHRDADTARGLADLERPGPARVPLEREQYELSVEADRYTLATRRAFVEFMRDAARPATGSSTSDEPSESVTSAAGKRPG